MPPPRGGEPARIDAVPPKPIVERPGESPPDPQARWIEGYWDWDKAAKDFVWVTGTWRVPPSGRFWVGGYWTRDKQGWYRVPGFWSDPLAGRNDWQTQGPPADRPDEVVGPPPAPGAFHIPGQYVPSGMGVVWRPGFWARAQPGWEWIPARWVRLSDGWSFREGRWERAKGEESSPSRDAQAASNPSGRRVVARPANGLIDLPRDTATAPDRDISTTSATTLQPIPEGGQTLPPPAMQGSIFGRSPGPVVPTGAAEEGPARVPSSRPITGGPVDNPDPSTHSEEAENRPEGGENRSDNPKPAAVVPTPRTVRPLPPPVRYSTPRARFGTFVRGLINRIR
jgi:hypothetical protein